MCFRFELLLQSLGACTNIFGKVLSPSDFVILGGPAGGSAPGKVLRLQERIVYDS